MNTNYDLPPMNERPLPLKTLKMVLEFHDIEYRTLCDNTIIVKEYIRDEDGFYTNWTDLTKFTFEELKTWLGYTS